MTVVERGILTARQIVWAALVAAVACGLAAVFYWPIGNGFHKFLCPTDEIDFDTADRNGDGRVSYDEARYTCNFVVEQDPLFEGCDSYVAIADGVQLMTVCKGEPPDSAELERLRRLSEESLRRHEIAKSRFDAAIPHLRLERIYYLSETTNTDVPVFNGFPVASETHPSSGMGKAIRADLRKIVRHSPDSAAACFFPHHGLRFVDGRDGARYDVLMCFDCGNYRVVTSDEGGSFGDAFHGINEQAWDDLFHASGIVRVE